jgi:hypothetical protein
MTVPEILHLLLAYQDVDMQIQKIQERRSEYDNEEKSAKKKLLLKKNAKDESLKQKRLLAHQREEIEYEINKIQDTIRQLSLDLNKVRTNKEYKILLGRIESLKNKKTEMEDQWSKIMEQEENFKKEVDNKELDLLEEESQYEQTVKEIKEKQKSLDDQIVVLQQSLAEIEKELGPEGSGFLLYYKRLRARLNQPVVEIKNGTCSGCNIKVPTSLLCDSLKFEGMVTCDRCGRIVFSTTGIIRCKISSMEIENVKLRLPPLIQLYCKDGDIIKLFDFWNISYDVKIEDGYIIRVGDIFNNYKLLEGDYIFIQEISREEKSYRLTPELISEKEVYKILSILESVDKEYVDLNYIINSVMREKADIFGFLLIKGELRRKILEDPRFVIFGDRIKIRKAKSIIITQISGKQKQNVRVSSHIDGIEARFRLTEEALKEGYYIVGRNLRAIFENFEDECYITIITYVDSEIKCSFSKRSWSVNGLSQWYKDNDLSVGDIVYLKLDDEKEKKFRIYTDWRRDIDKLREEIIAKGGKVSPEGILSHKEIIYIVLTTVGRELHYRDIYTRAQEIQSVKIVSIIGTLSRYNRRIFVNTGKGHWGLLDWYPELVNKQKDIIQRGKEITPGHEDIMTDEELWKAIAEIETHDLVYETLKRQKKDLFYEDIAKILGEMLKIDPQRLMEVSFLNPKDERFIRLDNGAWILKEFIEVPEEEEIPKTPVAICSRKKLLIGLLVALMIILVILGIYKFLNL